MFLVLIQREMDDNTIAIQLGDEFDTVDIEFVPVFFGETPMGTDPADAVNTRNTQVIPFCQ